MSGRAAPRAARLGPPPRMIVIIDGLVPGHVVELHDGSLTDVHVRPDRTNGSDRLRQHCPLDAVLATKAVSGAYNGRDRVRGRVAVIRRCVVALHKPDRGAQELRVHVGVVDLVGENDAQIGLGLRPYRWQLAATARISKRGSSSPGGQFAGETLPEVLARDDSSRRAGR